MVGNSLVAFLLAFFGVASVSTTVAPYSDAPTVVVDSRSYDSTADGSTPEYTYSTRSLSLGDYQKILSGAFVRSSKSGSGILVVQYGDFSSASSQKLHEDDLFGHLEDSFSGIPLKRVDKYFAATATGAAAESARLAYCGGSLGNAEFYYDSVDALFKGYSLSAKAGKTMTADVAVPQLAKHMGISQKRIRTCMDDEKTFSAVASAKSEFASFGFVGTPAVLLVSERTLHAIAVSGASPLDYYGTAVALLLADESSAQ